MIDTNKKSKSAGIKVEHNRPLHQWSSSLASFYTNHPESIAKSRLWPTFDAYWMSVMHRRKFIRRTRLAASNSISSRISSTKFHSTFIYHLINNTECSILEQSTV